MLSALNSALRSKDLHKVPALRGCSKRDPILAVWYLCSLVLSEVSINTPQISTRVYEQLPRLVSIRSSSLLWDCQPRLPFLLFLDDNPPDESKISRLRLYSYLFGCTMSVPTYF